MYLTRRLLLAGLGAACFETSIASADEAALPLSIAVRSPWMSNAVALTSGGTIFLGLPRFPGYEDTPSVVRIEPDGKLVPFPGNGWNGWAPGSDGQNMFVYVNTVHVFSDDTLWCVDQGALLSDSAPPGAQKLIQLDSNSGAVLKIVRFSQEILPPHAKLNDLRIHDQMIYLTDSGIGGLIVHDLATGKTLRRLSGYKQVRGIPWGAKHGPKHAGAKPKHGIPNSDMIELTKDGAWLYWAAPTGPLYRLPTALLRDASLTDDELAAKIEKITDTPVMGGTAMDDLGNLYISDILKRQILLLSPSGDKAVLAGEQDMVSPDALFISKDRTLYIPSTQQQLTPEHTGGPNLVQKPFKIFSLKLPERFSGILLGNAVTGV